MKPLSMMCGDAGLCGGDAGLCGGGVTNFCLYLCCVRRLLRAFVQGLQLPQR